MKSYKIHVCLVDPRTVLSKPSHTNFSCDPKTKRLFEVLRQRRRRTPGVELVSSRGRRRRPGGLCTFYVESITVFSSHYTRKPHNTKYFVFSDKRKGNGKGPFYFITPTTSLVDFIRPCHERSDILG